jgi:hypothetical protein
MILAGPSMDRTEESPIGAPVTGTGEVPRFNRSCQVIGSLLHYPRSPRVLKK